MMRKALVLPAVVLFFLSVVLSAQDDPPDFEASGRLRNGLELYGRGMFAEASAEFGGIAPESGEYGEALYWTALAELSRGNYRESLSRLETLERHDPGNRHMGEILYHRGRLYYYLGRYDEAVIALSAYSETAPGAGRKAAAVYWVGESLYAMGQYDRAETVFAGIVGTYPESAKYEAARYRMELIKQKKIEAELLSMLKWNHEESLKTVEEYQRREKMYDQAIAAYQKRVVELEGGAAGVQDTRQFDAAGPESFSRETAMRLLSIKGDVINLSNVITERLHREEEW